MKFRIYLLILLSFFMFCAKQPVVLDMLSDEVTLDLDDTISLDPDAIYGKLDNGLQYIIRANHKPENRAELRLVVNAGSILEDDNQQGLAHFCEHMAFNGTKRFEKQALVDYLESIGMRFGPEINAYTGFDETVYMLEIPTDSLEIVETAFQILEDWAQSIQFDDEEIDKERGVILEEWRLGRGANARIRDKQFPILFHGSKYADRIPIGDTEVLETFEYQTLKQFYLDWYRPDLMAVVAVGNFDPTWIENKIQTHFSGLKNPENYRERENSIVPDHADTKISIVTDSEATQNQINLYYKYDLSPVSTVSEYRRKVIEYIYDIMLNNRLTELARTENPPYLTASAGNSILVNEKGAYSMGALVEDGGIAFGLKTLLTEARRVKEYGFTESELERTKIQLLRFMEKMVLEKDKTESRQYASEYVRYFTENEPAPGIVYESQLFHQYMPDISIQDVNTLSDQWIGNGNLAILISGPEKMDLFFPDESDILQIFNDVQEMEIEPYKDKVSDEPLVASIPNPGEIIKIIENDTLGLTEWHLSNGLRVVLKSTDFKNDEILFKGYSLGGSSLVPDSVSIAASTASTIIRESGAGVFDRTTLQKKLAGKIVRVSPQIGGLTEGMSGQCSPQDMETMFQLIHLYFTAPRMDSTAYLSYKERIGGFLANRDARPESAYNDTIQVTMAQYHPRRRPWSNAMLDEMDLKYAYQFYKDRFADASDFTFYFVGNFTSDEIKPYILTYLASLPDINREESWRDVGIETPKGHIEKNINRGMEPKSRVTMIFTGPLTYTKLLEHRFGSMLDVLRIRLRKIIREELGGTYGVNVSGSVYQIPKETFDIRISFGCKPSRVDELTQAVFMQIDTLKQIGPRNEDIEKVQESQLRTYEINLKKNNYWLNTLYASDLHQRSYMDILTFPEWVHSLDTTEIQNIATTCFHLKNYVWVVLYPEDFSEEIE